MIVGRVVVSLDREVLRKCAAINSCVQCFQEQYAQHQHVAAVHTRSQTKPTSSPSAAVLPAHARVVICGAGVVGTSLAYQLVQKGWSDVVVLDKGRVGSGTSWHGPGIVAQFRAASERAIITSSAQIYKKLKEEGHDIGWRECGSLNVAQTRDRWVSLQRFYTQARAEGVECELLSPRDIHSLNPYLRVDDLQGGVWLPSDGVANSLELCTTLAHLAKEGGVRFIEECNVKQVLTTNGCVSAVDTNVGNIRCEYFANCSGLWSHEVALNTEIPVRVPVHAAIHTYITTKPLPDVTDDPLMLPILQDYDGRVYARRWGGGLLAGGFEVFGKPVFHTKSPKKFQFQLLPEDWERFRPLYDKLIQRIPCLSRTEIKHLHTGPENFTPDGKWILGETPDVKNYFVGCGMNGNSVLGAGGIGKALAEWIIEGEPTLHLLPFDIKRFMELHNNKKFLRERIKEISGRHYSLLYPQQSEFRLARKLRCSPLYTMQEADGAVFGERMGFERALYFDTTKRGDEAACMSPGSFGKPGWFEFVRDEYVACRTGVGLIDLSSLTKFQISVRPLYDKLIQRIPCLSRTEIKHLHTGPENFTPDGKWILGETPDVKNYFVGCGMNGNSVLGAGGIGKALAEWIIEGEPTLHLLPFDIKRFMELHNNKKFLRERIKEISGRHYSLLYPQQSEFRLARKLRCSPLYTMQEADGAVFGERMGFERALYFDTTKRGDEAACMSPGSFGKPGWFEFVRDEYVACRTGVGLIDLSSLTKFQISSAGTEAMDFLQHLCSNDLDIPVRSIVQTGMQNERGGFENDCIIVRQAENVYFMVSPTIQYTRIKEWIFRHLPPDGSVTVNDVTSMYTVLNVVGPKSRELMTELTNTNMKIHPFTYKEVNVGYASGIMVMGFTNTGEPGYSLYVPSEYALHIHDRLMETGRDYGLRNVGFFALRYLRIEKFIPYWAEEMDSNTTPYEVNRGYKVKMEKDYFLGKFALMKQFQKGVARRLVLFTIEDHDVDHDVWPWGKEPIYRNGIFVGTTTSAGFGFTLNRLVCMAFVHHHLQQENDESMIVTSDYVLAKGVKYEIDIAGKLFPIRPSLHSPKIPVISLDMPQYIPKARKNLVLPKK